MHWVRGLTLYIVIWWIALFIVLPIGIRPVADADASSGWRGAPERPQLGQKIVMTTVLAAVLWAIWCIIVINDWLNLRSGWLAIPDK